ncbi:hypothetical protein [Streptomyces melanosporofaciens]|uniref:hypothetical protein n=1 Tax=Streptomyces melanosporofaciens TaxID=67327 RepID=UPI000B886C67|nr:hypothetical protein [Streptomyces melanosporofaciens]
MRWAAPPLPSATGRGLAVAPALGRYVRRARREPPGAAPHRHHGGPGDPGVDDDHGDLGALGVGTHAVVVIYSGSTDFLPSTGIDTHTPALELITFAAYSADANFNGSTGPAYTQVIT